MIIVRCPNGSCIDGGANGVVEFTEVSFPGMSPGYVSLESGNTSGTGFWTAGMGTSGIMGSSGQQNHLACPTSTLVQLPC